MRIPRVKDCIEYVKSCGFTYEYYNRPWYVFRREKQITFTLTEIRDAFKNGF